MSPDRLVTVGMLKKILKQWKKRIFRQMDEQISEQISKLRQEIRDRHCRDELYANRNVPEHNYKLLVNIGKEQKEAASTEKEPKAAGADKEPKAAGTDKEPKATGADKEPKVWWCRQGHKRLLALRRSRRPKDSTRNEAIYEH
jgi:hypothetical protein